MKKEKKQRKPGLIVLLAVSSALLLLVTIGLITLGFRTVLQTRYIAVIRNELTAAYEQMSETDFASDTLQTIQDEGLFVTVFDTASGQVYANGREFVFSETTPQPEQGPKPDDRRREEVFSLQQRVDRKLSGNSGTFFSGDGDEDALGVPEPEVELFRYREIELCGMQDGKYFRLSCVVSPLNTAMSLALEIATAIGLAVWVISLIVLLLLMRRILKPAKDIAQTAQKIADLDFSQRCQPALSREMNDMSQSINTMADRLQENIIALQQTNEQLSAELTERKHQQQLNVTMISNLSHDLKTPLAIISGYAEGLSEGIAKTPEQTERYCSTIFKETEHMQTIVTKMLSISRLETGEIPLRSAVFDVAELTHDIVQSFSLDIEKAALQVRYEGEDELFVYSDYECIRQVLINYIQNSIFHINGGSDIRIRLTAQKEAAEIAIANSSAPLSDEAQVKIWDKLYRGDSARQRQHGEVGLGLSIVKGNMERLGWPYGVRNLTEENMVEFYIRLPLAAPEGEGTL